MVGQTTRNSQKGLAQSACGAFNPGGMYFRGPFTRGDMAAEPLII